MPGPIIDLLFKTKIQGELTPVEQSLETLTMRLRLTGRDLMRLGSFLTRVGNTFHGFMTRVIGTSGIWQDVSDGLTGGLEELGEVIGEGLAPVLDFLGSVLEKVAEFLEWLGPVGTTVIGVFFVLGWLVPKVVGALLSFAGALNLLVGIVSRAKISFVGFRDALHILLVYFLKGPTAAARLLEELKRWDEIAYAFRYKLLDTGKAVGKFFTLAQTAAGDFAAQWRTNIGQAASGLAALGKKGLAVIHQIEGGLAGIISPLTTFEGEVETTEGTTEKTSKTTGRLGRILGRLRRPLRGVTKEQEKLADASQRGSMTILGAAVATGLFALAAIALSPILESLSDLAEALGSALAPIIEPIADIIAALADFVEQHPEVVWAVGAIILAFLGFKILPTIGALISGFIAKLLGLLGITVPTANWLAFGKGLMFVAFGIAAVAAGFGAAIYLMGQSGFTMQECITILWNLVAAITVTMGVIILFGVAALISGVALIPLAKLLLAVAVALIAFGIACLLAGAGMALFGLGIKFAAEGLVLVAQNLVGVIAAIGALVVFTAALFLFAAALAAAGVSGLLAMTGLIAASVGFFAFSAAVFLTATALLMLAAAVAALAAALRAVPDWARGFVGGMLGGLAAIGGAIMRIFVPSAQEGGLVTRGGLVYLHPGELVVPAGEVAGGTYYNTFYISATIREEADIQRLAEEVNRLQSSKIGVTM